MTVLNVIRRPVTVIVQGRGLMGFKGDKGDPGNLTGPASSVNENIPIFDGVTGDKLKDSGVKLSDKADITALETEKKLLMDEIDALKKASIENSNAPYLTVSDYGDVTLAKNSVGVGTMGIDGVTVTNLSVAGDTFVGWAGCDTVIDGWATKSADAGTRGSISAAALSNVVAGHKYLVHAKIRLNSGYNNNTHQKDVLMRFGSPWSTGDFVELLKGTTAYQDGTELTLSAIATATAEHAGGDSRIYLTAYNPSYAINVSFAQIKLIDLTVRGLGSLTAGQVDRLIAGGYFSGKKTFGGVGCLVSKDSTEAETGRMYFETDPMYSNDTAKDVLTYSGGKYYHTHNVDSDGMTIAEPYNTEVDTNGQIVCLSGGTVTYEPWYPDIGIYTDKFTLTKAITAVKELYKYGSETPITDAVIAEDGLSFTSASLTAGDLAYGVFEFEEPLRPLMTIKSRNDDATVVDTSTGTVYTFRPVVTDGVIASWELTEV